MKTNKNIIAYHTNITLAVFAMSLFVFLMSVFFVQTDFHFSKVISIAKHVVLAEDGGDGGGEGNGEGGSGSEGGSSGESGGSGGSESGNGEGSSGSSGGVSGEVGGGCCGEAPGNGEGSSGSPGGVSGEVGGGCCGGGGTETGGGDVGGSETPTTVTPPVINWTPYCTMGDDPNGNTWQWWEKSDGNPIEYRFIRNGDGDCTPPPTGSLHMQPLVCGITSQPYFSWNTTNTNGKIQFNIIGGSAYPTESVYAGTTAISGTDGHGAVLDAGTYTIKLYGQNMSNVWVLLDQQTFTVNPCPIQPTDLCPNIPGVQLTIPQGLILDVNGNCVPPPTDVCPNIPGDQATVPTGLIVDANGNCVPPPDLCPNIAGNQTALPAGWSIDASGNCVPPVICTIIPPAITSPLTASGVVGTPFSYTISVTGGVPLTIGVSGSMPAGVTYNAASSTISGTPTSTGTFNVSITASNPCGDDAKTLVITITGTTICTVEVPRITSALSASGVIGASFSYTVTASGGTPITITVTGTLPAGLSYDAASSTISGVPTTEEVKNITIVATNPCGSDTQTLTLRITPAGCTSNCGGGGGCTTNCGGGGGCTSNCGGGGGPSLAPVFLYKVASSSPLAAASVYLSQIPYTGFGDSALIFLFFMGLALFSYNAVMFLSKRKWALFGGANVIEYQKVYVPQTIAQQITTPVPLQPNASEIAREMGVVLAGILKEQDANKIPESVKEVVPQVTASDIAHEMGTVLASILKEQVSTPAPIVRQASASEIAYETGAVLSSILREQDANRVVQPVKVVAPQATASEIAHEMGTVFSSILNKHTSEQPIVEPVKEVSAKDIAQEVGAVVSGIFQAQVTPHLKVAIEEKAPVTVNVSIGTIHVGNNVTNNTTNTTNNQLAPAEPVKIEAPKAEEIIVPKEVSAPFVDNQILIEALRAKANDERILISPLGFDIIALEAKQDTEIALSLMTKLIDEAKGTYPRQHGWIELNKEKITTLLTAVTQNV